MDEIIVLDDAEALALNCGVEQAAGVLHGSLLETARDGDRRHAEAGLRGHAGSAEPDC